MTGEGHERGKGSLGHVNWLSERLLGKISELLIDKKGGGKERAAVGKNVINCHQICLLNFSNP